MSLSIGAVEMHADQPATPKPNPRWFHLTPGRLLVVLLAVEAALLLSERFKWFPFNEYKGWTVLIALAAVGVFLLVMLIWFVFALLFRRRFQFSIRALLVLTIAVALPFSWLAVEIKWAREQKEAVEAIGKMCLHVSYEKEFDKSTSPPILAWLRERLGNDFFDNVTYVFHDVAFLTINKITNDEHKHLKSLMLLHWLDINNTTVMDIGLEHLKGLTQLRWLSLSSTKVTDAGLEHLKGLKQLQELDISNTAVSDAGLEYLKGLTQLKWLEISNTTVNDAGLEHIKGLTQLQGLDLKNTTVTDAGLEHLKGLTQLELMILSKTKVTDAGIAKLQKALPKLKIEQK